MKTGTILKELEKYLPKVKIVELRLNMSVKYSIVICMSITDIINTYHDTQENENIVADLLSKLCKNHFK